MPALPLAACHTDNSGDFRAVERLRQHIVGSQVEDFRPKALHGKPGSYDQQRRIGQGSQFLQNLFPRARLQIGFTHDHGNSVPPQSRHRRRQIGARIQLPFARRAQVAFGTLQEVFQRGVICSISPTDRRVTTPMGLVAATQAFFGDTSLPLIGWCAAWRDVAFPVRLSRKGIPQRPRFQPLGRLSDAQTTIRRL